MNAKDFLDSRVKDIINMMKEGHFTKADLEALETIFTSAAKATRNILNKIPQ